MAIETVRPPRDMKRVEFTCHNPVCRAGLSVLVSDGFCYRDASGLWVQMNCPHCHQGTMLQAELFLHPGQTFDDIKP